MGTQTGRAYTKSGSVEKYESSVGVRKTSGSGTVSVTNTTTGDYKVELSDYSTGGAANYDVTTVTNYGGKTKTFYWKKDITTITMTYGVGNFHRSKFCVAVYIDKSDILGTFSEVKVTGTIYYSTSSSGSSSSDVTPIVQEDVECSFTRAGMYYANGKTVTQDWYQTISSATVKFNGNSSGCYVTGSNGNSYYLKANRDDDSLFNLT